MYLVPLLKRDPERAKVAWACLIGCEALEGFLCFNTVIMYYVNLLKVTEYYGNAVYLHNL